MSIQYVANQIASVDREIHSIENQVHTIDNNISRKQKELSTDVVKLNSDAWALNVVPPWIKWQDYLLHLESGQDRRVKSGEMDPTDTVAQTVNLLAQSFGLNTSLVKLFVYSSDDDKFFNVIESCSINLKKKIIDNVQEGISFYSPELQCGYLARYSVNHVTRVASQFIYFTEAAFPKTILDSKKEFHKLIWLEAVTYFFGKVKNPKRKTDTLQDIRNAIQKEQFDDRAIPSGSCRYRCRAGPWPDAPSS